MYDGSGTGVPSSPSASFLVELWFRCSHDNPSPVLKSHNEAGRPRLKAQTRKRPVPSFPDGSAAHLPAGSCGAVIPSLEMAENRNQQKYILGGKDP